MTLSRPNTAAHPPHHRRQLPPRRRQLSKHPLADSDRVATRAAFRSTARASAPQWLGPGSAARIWSLRHSVCSARSRTAHPSPMLDRFHPQGVFALQSRNFRCVIARRFSRKPCSTSKNAELTSPSVKAINNNSVAQSHCWATQRKRKATYGIFQKSIRRRIFRIAPGSRHNDAKLPEMWSALSCRR